MDLSKALKLFGLEISEQKAYQALGGRELTVLELSRKTGINRPNLYRILEALHLKGLIKTRIDDKTTYYQAADLKMFEALVREQEYKAQEMRTSLSSIQSHLHTLATDSVETKVHYYRGIRGIQHMLLKMHSAPNTNIYMFGSDDWRKVVSVEFAEELRAETVRQNSIVYELLNPEDDVPITETGENVFTKNTTYILHHYHHRTIPRQLLTLDREIMVYKQFIHFYSYLGNDVTGIEIENELYAKILKQLFLLVWDKGKVVDRFGEGSPKV